MDIIELLKNTISNFYLILIFRFMAFFLYYIWLSRLFAKEKHQIVLAIVYAGVLSFSFTAILFFVSNEPLALLLTMILNIVFVFIFFRTAFDEVFISSILVVLLYMCVKSIVVGGFSIYVNQNMYQVLQVQSYQNTIQVAIWLLMTATILFLQTVILAKEYIHVHNVPNQKSFLLMVNVALTLFMLFQSYNYYYNMEMIWFSISQILTAVVVLCALYVSVNHAIQVATMIDTESNKQTGVRSSQGQTAVANTVLKLEEQRNALCQEGAEKASIILEQLDHSENVLARSTAQQMLNTFQSAKQYEHSFCNQEALNAVFIEYACIFQEQNIDYQMSLEIPWQLKNSEVKEFQVLLQEVLSYSLGMLQRMDQTQERYINIVSTDKDGWLLIKIENPYIGLLKIKNGVVQSGAYQEIASQIKRLKGSCDTDVDQSKKIYRCSLRIYHGK